MATTKIKCAFQSEDYAVLDAAGDEKEAYLSIFEGAGEESAIMLTRKRARKLALALLSWSEGA